MNIITLKTISGGSSQSSNGASNENTGNHHQSSKITYDIKSAALRQGSFYYQVSLSHYKDEAFMRDAFKRYKMYLLLKKENKSTFLVPCYDIDLVWHTHQVHPQAYQCDTTAILGF